MILQKSKIDNKLPHNIQAHTSTISTRHKYISTMSSTESLNILTRQVAALNNQLPDFNKFWSETDKLTIMVDGVNECMSAEYQKAFKEWMFPSLFRDDTNAMHDFLDKISSTNSNHRINIDDKGFVWIDMSLSGTVDGQLVTKWTRIMFELVPIDRWELYFDTTLDGLNIFNDPRANTFAAEMHKKELANEERDALKEFQESRKMVAA